MLHCSRPSAAVDRPESYGLHSENQVAMLDTILQDCGVVLLRTDVSCVLHGRRVMLCEGV